MSINADLSMRTGATRYGLTETHRVSLYQQPSLISAVTYPAALYANSAGELYWNDGASNQVKITSGGSVSGSPGSITGTGYGTGGVEVNWDAGASDYHFYSGTGTYADVNCTAVQLSDGSSNLLRIAAQSMSANYTLTLPAAVPGSNNTVMTMATTGTVSNTGTPTVTTLTATGAVTAGSYAGGSISSGVPSVLGLAVGASGLTVVSNADVDGTVVAGAVTVDSGGHVTVSGTGKFKHGTREFPLPLAAGNQATGSAWTYDTTGTNRYWLSTAASDSVDIPIYLPVGSRILSVSARVNPNTAAMTVGLVGYVVTTGARFTNETATTSGTSTQTVTVTPASPPTISSVGEWYSVMVTSGDANDEFYGAWITYDFP